ncbi:hypothetical protein B5M42_022415 [Paenibacillus athensensis]|uniref:DUF2157 domain-containing protein n=1 Tax=Paenibacillus athensensis TaxID=1967502 RepID=A0A4Y8PVF5_9BACL|nr:hypothetical protein [Paenibacillus athensensis]MCD1261560.1 hypothetical protein [Paenibacillus athensensis]
MDAEKRKTIVREIEHWRRSKLLPGQYCDFLLNLYLEDGAPKPKSLMGVSATAVTESNWKIWMVSIAVVAALALSALNFNSFALPMQIGVSALFAVLCYTFAYRKRSSSPLMTYMLCGLASVFVLFIGVYILHVQGVTAPAAFVGYVAFCSLLWLITGLAGRMAIFQFSGWGGLLCVYGWLLLRRLEEPGWLPLEISWIPVSIVFIWLAWLVHHRNKQAAGVLLLVGCLVWLAPEGSTLLVEVSIASRWIQLSFIGKLLAGGGVLFALRKKWIEWIM